MESKTPGVEPETSGVEPEDVGSRRLTSTRRSDRAVEDEAWIKEMLRYEPVCVLGTVADERPFLRPMGFLYRENDHAIYFHGAIEGRAHDNIAGNPKVTLCVYRMGRWRTHERAFEFFMEHAGVVVFGAATMIDDGVAKNEIMQEFFEKYTPHLKVHIDYEPASPEELDQVALYRLDIDAWSGKVKWTDDIPAGTFWYDEVQSAPPPVPWEREGMAPLTEEGAGQLSSQATD